LPQASGIAAPMQTNLTNSGNCRSAASTAASGASRSGAADDVRKNGFM
jgi:hypothetical protein